MTNYIDKHKKPLHEDPEKLLTLAALATEMIESLLRIVGWL